MNQLGFCFSGVAEIVTREPLKIEVADHYPQPYRKACFDTLYDGGLDCFEVSPEERATEDGWNAATGHSGRLGGLMWFGTPSPKELEIIESAYNAAELTLAQEVAQ